MDESQRFASAYDNTTTLTPASLLVLAIGAIAMFVVPRRYMFLPLVVVTAFVPVSQRLVILGMDFAFLRLMTMIAWARLAARSEFKRFAWSPIDTVFTAWILWRTIATVLRTGSFGALVHQLGLSVDALGIYFLARMILRGWRDLDAMIVSFSIAAIPVALAMLHESQTGRNLATMFFGAKTGMAVARDGAVRAMCGYAHPIIAGAAWASVFPLVCARWWNRRASRLFTVVAAIAVFSCVINSSSSTPLLGTLIGMVGAAAWVMRRNMVAVRWMILAAVLLLEVALDKPIWHLFHRVSAIGLDASTGYHRYRLFDAFVRHFTDWAPLGVNSTAYWGSRLEDVTNAFIVQAVQGGLIGLLLILTLFYLLFQRNGVLLRQYRGRRPEEIYLWALGVTLFSHTAMMNAMGYLWQMQPPWYACFAMIAAAPQLRRDRAPRRERLTPVVPVAKRSRSGGPERASPPGGLPA